MRKRNGTERDRIRQRMMAALDGELEAAEREELLRIVDSDAELAAEWKRMTKVKEVTQTMVFRKPPEEVWGRYWGSIYNRVERGIGWVLVSIGAVVLVSYALWQALGEILADTAMPGFLKVAIFSVIVGLAVLLVSVVREKLFTRRRDPYKEVER